MPDSGSDLFLIGIVFAFLKAKASALISGFNFVSREEREKYDQERMSRDMRNTLFLWAVIWMVGAAGVYFVSVHSVWIAGIVWLAVFFKDVHLDNEKAFGKYKIK